jgi:hypothetical protein
MKLKNILLALAAVLMMALGAQTCESRLTTSERAALSGKVEIVAVWGGHAGSKGQAWRNVTLVIANPTAKARKVRASCAFKDDGALFGEKVLVVRAGYKAKAVIRGLPRLEGMGNSLTCGLEAAR